MTLLALVSTATAQDDATNLTRALNNFQQEITTCIAYYTVAKICVGTQDVDLTAKFDSAIDSLTQIATKTGDVLGMTVDAMTSRLRIEERKMRTLTDSNCMNISSLDDRHALRCAQILKDGDSVLNELLAKEGL